MAERQVRWGPAALPSVPGGHKAAAVLGAAGARYSEPSWPGDSSHVRHCDKEASLW